MKNIIIVIADYAPIPSSNTNCLEPYLECLEHNGWSVDVITRRAYSGDPLVQQETKLRRVFRIDDYKLMNTLLCRQMVSGSPSGMIKWIHYSIAYFLRIVYYLKFALGTYESYAAGWDEEELDRLMKKLSGEKQYRYILSVSFPEKTHEAAKRFVERYQPECRWLLLEFDPFCYNRSNYSQRSFKRLYRIQDEIFHKSYRILCTPQLLDFYLKTPFKKYRDKFYSLEYANIRYPEINYEKVTPIPFEKDRIHFLYCGVLKKDVRNPQALFDIFSYLPYSYKLYIMSGSNVSFWKKAILNLGNRVTVIGEQTRDTAYDCMKRADVLINIGNSVAYQIPGKIFEYMSFGKPIIHISNMEEDPCLCYLRRYPLALVIRADENKKEAAIKIDTFNRSCAGSNIQFEDIKQAFGKMNPEITLPRFIRMLEDM